MEQDHAEGDDRHPPPPDPAEKAAGHIHHQQHQQGIEPEGVENQLPGAAAPDNGNSAQAAEQNNDQQSHGQLGRCQELIDFPGDFVNGMITGFNRVMFVFRFWNRVKFSHRIPFEKISRRFFWLRRNNLYLKLQLP